MGKMSYNTPNTAPPTALTTELVVLYRDRDKESFESIGKFLGRTVKEVKEIYKIACENGDREHYLKICYKAPILKKRIKVNEVSGEWLGEYYEE